MNMMKSLIQQKKVNLDLEERIKHWKLQVEIYDEKIKNGNLTIEENYRYLILASTNTVEYTDAQTSINRMESNIQIMKSHPLLYTKGS